MTENSENKIDDKIASVLEKFPFLSYGEMDDKPYLGIIQNSDNQLVSMYVLDLLPSQDMRSALLDFGMNWWWESNRQVPINVFIKDKSFRQFRVCLRQFSAKSFQVIAGPSVSLAETMNRRVRKRQVTLVRDLD